MNVEFKINIGEYEVLASGVVMTHLDKGIQFHIGGLTFDIGFSVNTENQESKINATTSPDNPKYLKIDLVNYDNNLGKGLVFPVMVGNFDGKDIYLQFSTSTFSNTKTREFVYTWLIKPANL